MKARVIYLSKSGNSATLSIKRAIPGTKLHNTISGFVGIDKDSYKIGDEIDLPTGLKVTVEKRNAVNEETGEINEFNWLIFE